MRKQKYHCLAAMAAVVFATTSAEAQSTSLQGSTGGVTIAPYGAAAPKSSLPPGSPLPLEPHPSGLPPEVERRRQEVELRRREAERVRATAQMADFGFTKEAAEEIFTRRWAVKYRSRQSLHPSMMAPMLTTEEVAAYEKEMKALLGERRYATYREFERLHPYLPLAAQLRKMAERTDGVERLPDTMTLAKLLRKLGLNNLPSDSPYPEDIEETHGSFADRSKHWELALAKLPEDPEWKQMPPGIRAATTKYFSTVLEEGRFRQSIADLPPKERMAARRKQIENRRAEAKRRAIPAHPPGISVPQPQLPPIY